MTNRLTGKTSKVETLTRQWLEDVVVGLNLCPFAAGPLKRGRVNVCISDSPDEAGLLFELHAELRKLDEIEASNIETTLLVVPELLRSFDAYLDFLELAEGLLEQYNWCGIYQLASFHPQYQFEGTDVDVSENLTNRSPYPILHILREDSLSKAVATYPEPENIPQRNIQRMNTLDDAEKKRLFPYLFAE